MTSTYQDITNKIIEALEQGVKPWEKDWSGNPWTLPLNSISKNRYSGINVLLLMLANMKNHFTSNNWATFKQIQSEGGQVKKGSKATYITFFKTLKVTEEKDGEEKEKNIPMLKTFAVFNLDQIDGLDGIGETPKTYDTKPIDALDAFVSNTQAIIKSEGLQPAYYPTEDVIRMPKIEFFKSQEGYYATILHELGHWTGSKDRLARELKPNSDRANYGFEELIAELTASFLCADLNIKCNIENHASYLNSWIKLLKTDTKAIFKAASEANKAAMYLNNLQPKESTR